MGEFETNRTVSSADPINQRQNIEGYYRQFKQFSRSTCKSKYCKGPKNKSQKDRIRIHNNTPPNSNLHKIYSPLLCVFSLNPPFETLKPQLLLLPEAYFLQSRISHVSIKENVLYKSIILGFLLFLWFLNVCLCCFFWVIECFEFDSLMGTLCLLVTWLFLFR